MVLMVVVVPSKFPAIYFENETEEREKGRDDDGGTSLLDTMMVDRYEEGGQRCDIRFTVGNGELQADRGSGKSNSLKQQLTSSRATILVVPITPAKTLSDKTDSMEFQRLAMQDNECLDVENIGL
ncbi:hypothetical protein L2E82_21163 [Cichorium intybus]|uniref:Uncharacterized protein n=1 Tax=Cichorium intybus TaxID=13427 RepID=A0ACB9DVM6_CICIN|nr:hypothetical protein L2E82_21163 [Cichorium intybus]